MAVVVDTAVLELRTDGTAFFPDIDKADKSTKALGSKLQAIGKSVGGYSSSVSSLGQEFSKAFKKGDDSFVSMSGHASKMGELLAGAFATTAIIAAGKKVIDYAGHVTDLSQRLKISTDTVQRWEAAFAPSGVSIEAAAKASEMLSAKLIGGDKAAVPVLKAMGLELQKLKEMKPEERFIKVADAVGRIQDAGEKVYASKTLFGKGGTEMLAALDGHLGDTIKSFDDMGLVIDSKTIKAADDFGDQLGMMGKQLLAIVATVIGPLLPVLSALGSVLMWVGRNVIGPVLNVAVKSAITFFGMFWQVVSDVLGRLASLGSKLPFVGEKFQQMSDFLKDSSAVTGKYLKELWTNTEKTGETAAEAGPKLLGLGKDTTTTATAMKKFKDAVDEVTSHSATFDKVLQTVDGRVLEGAKFYIARGASLEKVAEMYKLTDGQIKAIKESMDVEKTVVAATTRVYEEFSTTLMAVSKARVQEGSDAFRKNLTVETDALRNALEIRNRLSMDAHQYQMFLIEREQDERIAALDWTGAHYKEALFAIAEETEAKMAVAEAAYQDSLAAMNAATDSWGNRFVKWIGAIPDLLERAFTGGGGIGGALKAMISGIGSDIGAGLFSAGGALNGLANGITKWASGLSKSFGNAIGLALPGIGSAIGALIGPIVSGIGKLFSSQEKKVNDMRDEFQRLTFGSFPAMAEAAKRAGYDLDRLLNTKKVEDFKREMQAMTDAIAFQDAAMATLDETAQRYGFTIEELGPALARQNLDKQAQQIFKDWGVLNAAMVDQTAIANRMGESINAWYHDSIAAGAEIPIAMKPILERMAELGKLTNAAGEQVTDLGAEGINWSMTMSDGFKALIKEVQALTDAISRGLGLAIGNTPPLRVPVIYEDPGFHPEAPEITPMAKGGFGTVTKPTLFLAGESGAENFSFSPVGAQVGAAGGGNQTIILEIDGREIGRASADYNDGQLRQKRRLRAG